MTLADRQRARASLRWRGLRVAARVEITPSGILAAGVLVSGILLSTAVLVRAARSGVAARIAP